MNIGIVVLNYRGLDRTLDCLASLREMDLAGHRVTVVAVDNASGDGSAAAIRIQFPEFELIENPRNLGYAAGNNRGVEHLLAFGVDAILVLNNDTRVHPAALGSMISLLGSRPRIGVVGCVTPVVREGGVPTRVIGARLSWLLGTAKLVTTADRVEDVDYLSGAAMLVRREAWEAVGGLNEDYFLYWEDADFCLRLKRNGWDLAIALDAEVQHEEGATLGRGSLRQAYYFNREFVRFVLSHSPVPFWTLPAGYLLRTLRRLASGNWREVPVIFRGMAHGWKGRKSPYTEMNFQENP